MRPLRIVGPILMVVAAAAFFALVAAVVMLLWNALLPALFQLPVLGFWQAAGLLLLSRLLFGGLGRGRGGGLHGLRARFQSMTPEERANLRQRLRDRFRQQVGP